MSRSRCMLQVSHLDRFIEFCKGRGWVQVETKSIYEALRMRHADEKDPLIVHRRDKTNMGKVTLCHLTTWGNSDRLARAYIQSKKPCKKSSSKTAKSGNAPGAASNAAASIR